MNNIFSYRDYIYEMKSERKIVQDLARHLSFDKEIIKYLNTSRAKRTEGWRELLKKKLHGKNLDYINYITKNMVSDYNPQITGFIKFDNDGNFDKEHEEEIDRFDKLSKEDKLDDLNNRLINVEDILGINPENNDTVDKSKDALKDIGFEPDWMDEDDEDENKKDNDEEE